MKVKGLATLSLVLILLMNTMTAGCCGLVSRINPPGATAEAAAEATKAAAEQSAAQVTQTASRLPTESPAPGPTEPTTPPAAEVVTPPPMPSPETCAAESEPFWHWQVGRMNVKEFFFVTSSIGFAVGEPYTLLRTDDGGSTWKLWFINSSSSLNTICFSDQKVGWVAGNGGTILKTEDGGLTWQPQRTGTQADFYVIKFLDDRVGWAGGSNGTLLRTTDGGVTWSPSATGNQMNIVDLSFVDAQEGYVAGYDGRGPVAYVLHTTDGGATWDKAGYCGTVPEAIYAAKGQPVWTAGGWVGGAIWKSTGGELTTVAEVGRSVEAHFREVLFSDEQLGWAVGDSGLAVFTQDGGERWQSMGVSENVDWKTLRFTSEQEVVLAGYSPWRDGIQVAHSSDGGMTWSPAPAGNSITYRVSVLNVDFVDAWFGWTVIVEQEYSGEQTIRLLSTINGGQSWEKRPLPGKVSQIAFVDRLRGWAIGEAGLVARSDDGGRNWEIQPLSFPGSLQALSFVDQEHGWILSGGTGPGTCQEYEYQEPGHLTLFRTSSGGDEWEGPICVEAPSEMINAYSSFGPYQLPLRLRFVDRETGWIVGAKGVILKTTDGGLTWQPQPSGTAVDLTDVYFVDVQTGWVTGDQGVLLETTDGGVRWRQQRLGEGKLTGVRFVDRETGWVVPGRYYPAKVFYTTDRGQTWDEISVSQYRSGNTSSLDASDRHHVWIGTEDGLTAYTPVCVPQPPTASTTP